MPATHDAASRLPAVSGSSGRLVLCGRRLGTHETTDEQTWPGRVFEDPELDYVTAMRAFVAASAPRTALLNPDEERRRQAASPEWAAQRELRRAERALAQRRGHVYQRRKQEDAAWRALRHEHRERLRPSRWTREAWDTYRAQDVQWRASRAERRAALERRRAEDEVWRQERQRLRERRTPE